MFNHLVSGDGDSAEKHREFYDEYLAVIDLTAEYYMQTFKTVFVRHALPKGEMTHRGQLVDLTAIRNAGLLTVEGEKWRHFSSARPTPPTELCVEFSPRQESIITLPKGSAITASSTGPASGRRSPRAFASSSVESRPAPSHPSPMERGVRTAPEPPLLLL